jgi:hypothetical protein
MAPNKIGAISKMVMKWKAVIKLITIFKFNNNDNAAVTVFKAVFLIHMLKILLSFLFYSMLPDLYLKMFEKSRPEVIYSFGIAFAVIIAPLFETFLFQFLLFKLLKKTLKDKWWIVIVASLLFSLAHGFHPIKLILHFVSGMVFNSLYYSLKSSEGRAYIMVSIVHGLVNLIHVFFGVIANHINMIVSA